MQTSFETKYLRGCPNAMAYGISVLYNQFLTSSVKLSYKIAWEVDFAIEIDEEDWNKWISRIYKHILNVNLMEANFKGMSPHFVLVDLVRW